MNKFSLFLTSILLLASCSTSQSQPVEARILDVATLKQSTGYDIQGIGSFTSVYYLALESEDAVDVIPAEARDSFVDGYDYYRLSDSAQFYVEQSSGEWKEFPVVAGEFYSELTTSTYDIFFEDGEIVRVARYLSE